MHNDYDDFYDEVDAHELGYSAGKRDATATERRALANTLTRLRKLQADNPATHNAVLDAIASAHGLTTVTEVRYEA
jgi:hypothetical protein